MNQGPHHLFFIGSSTKWYNQKKSIFRTAEFGVSIGVNRNFDNRISVGSNVASAAVQLENLEVSFSYDLTTSIGFKAYEIGLGYIFE